MKWYKRDPDAFKGGTVALSLEEVGAYTLILDDLYSRDGSIADDIGYLCRLLRSDPRVVRRIRQRLLDLDKIQTSGGLVTNVRCTSELSSAQVRLSSGQNTNKTNGATPPRARATTTTREEREEKEKNLSKGFSPSLPLEYVERASNGRGQEIDRTNYDLLREHREQCLKGFKRP